MTLGYGENKKPSVMPKSLQEDIVLLHNHYSQHSGDTRVQETL